MRESLRYLVVGDTIIDEDDSLTITGSLVSRDIVAEYVKKDCK